MASELFPLLETLLFPLQYGFGIFLSLTGLAGLLKALKNKEMKA